MVNKKFYISSSKSKRARFAPFDFHVHTLGSADVRVGKRYAKLPEAIRDVIPILAKEPSDLADYDAKISDKWSADDYYKLLLAKKAALFEGQNEERENAHIAVLALTDHNVYNYSCAIASIASSRVDQDGLVILPGVELDVKFSPAKDKSTIRIHILCIFAPDTKESDIRMAISSALNDGGYRAGGILEVECLPTFISRLRSNQAYPAMCIAAHVGSSSGIQREVRTAFSSGTKLLTEIEADIVRLESEIALDDGFDKNPLITQLAALKEQAQNTKDEIAFDVLKVIGGCGFDGLQVAVKSDSYHYRRLHRAHLEKGRSVPLVSSDAHCIDDIFDCNGATPFLKVPNDFHKRKGKEVLLSIRDEALRFGETRTTYSKPDHVLTWLAGIQFKRQSASAVNYWPEAEEEFYIPLSRNLNCFIGGRGSGKSALLDAIAFVASSEQYKNEADKKAIDRSDWYKRAEATLAGWEVKLCWKSETDSTYLNLPKRAKFASKYFDANHKHTPVEIRDIDGQEILGDQAKTSEIEFYRIHDIEAMSQPQLLLRLFDNQRAGEFRSLSDKVSEYGRLLAEQRLELVELAGKINALTESETAAIRQYARRKASYDAVNTEAVRQEYQAIDSKASIRETFAKIVESWEKRLEQVNPPSSENVEKLKLFFQRVRLKLAEKKGSHPEVQELLKFLEGEASIPGFEKQLLNSIDAVQSLFEQGSERFAFELNARDEDLRTVKNLLEAKGLPANAKGREVKKETFEESKAALEEYRVLIGEMNTLLIQRKEIADALENACKEITRLRKEVAQSITTQLAIDLDRKVLTIEADAQPLQDQSAFEKWFSQYGRARHSKNSEEKFKVEIQGAFSPRRLSGKLIPLKIEPEKIEFSSTEDFSPLLQATCERLTIFRLEIEEAGLASAVCAELPVEIRSGIMVFKENEQMPGQLVIDAALRLDEIVIDDKPIVRLNDRPLDANSTARNVDELSPGQRCSAILPILLLTGTCPLIIDQPEDNLDNRLVRQVIVNILGSIKLKRQVIVATHNPNLPVLGDAEQVVVLRAIGRGEAKIEETGDLNTPKVVQYITEIMEGGREAFQYRESIYSPHWRGGAAAY